MTSVREIIEIEKPFSSLEKNRKFGLKEKIRKKTRDLYYDSSGNIVILSLFIIFHDSPPEFRSRIQHLHIVKINIVKIIRILARAFGALVIPIIMP